MSGSIKRAVFHAARAAGLFNAARRGTRRFVRILGYHGFATGDEARFRSKLFIRAETFRRRLQMLKNKGYRVIGLDEGVRRLRSGDVEPDTVVITIDDGFASTLHVAAPALHEFGFPATVYLTTYHMAKQTPVFDLVVAYMLWRSTQTNAVLPVGAQPNGAPVSIATDADRQAAADRLIAFGRSLAQEEGRVQLCRELGHAIGVDYDAVAAQGSFRLLSFDEARRLRELNVELALHTHRHRFPLDDAQACRAEIADNRRWLAERTGAASDHFCYPSGVYSPAQWPWLTDAGVVSATTCDLGLSRPGDPTLGLRRFVDGEMVTDLEFEAELSGFTHLLRCALRIDRAAGR